MTLGLVSIFSNSQCVSHIRCTPTQSVPRGFRCVQYIRLNNGIYLKATLSLDTTDRCIVHKQTNRDCASRATASLTTQQHQACSTNRVKNNKDLATRQQAGRNNLVHVGPRTNLITLLDSCVSSLTFSQHCHKTVT